MNIHIKRGLLAAAFLYASLSAALPQQTANVLGAGNFRPNFGGGRSIAATTTSSSVTFTGNDVYNTELYLYNAGTDLVFVRWGVGAQTAVTTDVPIPSGTVQVFTKALSDTVAVRSAASTATVYVITGEGR